MVACRQCSDAMRARVPKIAGALLLLLALTPVSAHASAPRHSTMDLQGGSQGEPGGFACRVGWLGVGCGMCDPVSQCMGVGTSCTNNGTGLPTAASRSAMAAAQTQCRCPANTQWSGPRCAQCASSGAAGLTGGPDPDPAHTVLGSATLFAAEDLSGGVTVQLLALGHAPCPLGAKVEPCSGTVDWVGVPGVTLQSASAEEDGAVVVSTSSTGQPTMRCGLCGTGVCCSYWNAASETPTSLVTGTAVSCVGTAAVSEAGEAGLCVAVNQTGYDSRTSTVGGPWCSLIRVRANAPSPPASFPWRAALVVLGASLLGIVVVCVCCWWCQRGGKDPATGNPTLSPYQKLRNAALSSPLGRSIASRSPTGSGRFPSPVFRRGVSDPRASYGTRAEAGPPYAELAKGPATS